MTRTRRLSIFVLIDALGWTYVQDSRFLDGPVGYVPAENLVGRAEIIFFSVDGSPAWAFWKWPWSVRPERLFTLL